MLKNVKLRNPETMTGKEFDRDDDIEWGRVGRGSTRFERLSLEATGRWNTRVSQDALLSDTVTGKIMALAGTVAEGRRIKKLCRTGRVCRRVDGMHQIRSRCPNLHSNGTCRTGGVGQLHLDCATSYSQRGRLSEKLLRLPARHERKGWAGDKSSVERKDQRGHGRVEAYLKDQHNARHAGKLLDTYDRRSQGKKKTER